MSKGVAAKDGHADPLDSIEESEYPGGLKLRAIIVALVLSIFLASLDTTIITTAIPSITSDFNSLEDVGWYGSAMFFPLAATQSVWGKAYKYFPVKHVSLLGIFIFEVGSLICALAPNSNAFIAGRAVTGTWAPIFMGLKEEDAVPNDYKRFWKSHEQHRDALVIDENKEATMWDYYKPQAASPLFNPLASPFEKINTMPKISLQVAGHDIFRDDGLILAYALQDHGVEVKLDVYPGVCHSFWVFAPGLTLSKKFVKDILEGFAWLLGASTENLGQGWETAMAMPTIQLEDTT